jgi:hypothetical protein
LLVRDLFLALHQWRTRHGLSEDDWLRLMVPVNMRTPGDRRLPAANVVSTIFLDQRHAADFDPRALLQKANRLMTETKRQDLALAWLLAMPVLQRLPRAWANARFSRRRCLYSTVLTNLGPVFAATPMPRSQRRLVVDDLTLDGVEFVPITRPLQCVGFSVTIYAGRITLAMRYDSRVLGPNQAQEVLDCYVSALRSSMKTCI